MTKQEADHIMEVVHVLLALFQHNALDAEPKIKELINGHTDKAIPPSTIKWEGY